MKRTMILVIHKSTKQTIHKDMKQTIKACQIMILTIYNEMEQTIIESHYKKRTILDTIFCVRGLKFMVNDKITSTQKYHF